MTATATETQTTHVDDMIDALITSDHITSGRGRAVDCHIVASLATELDGSRAGDGDGPGMGSPSVRIGMRALKIAICRHFVMRERRQARRRPPRRRRSTKLWQIVYGVFKWLPLPLLP